MTPERWQRIEALYAEALEQPRAAQADYVVARAGADTTLRDEVLSLIDAHYADADFLAQPVEAGRLAAWLDALPEVPGLLPGAPRPGDDIGGYRLLRVLGRGGMGTVYLAERRTEAFTQRVALKLLRRGLDTGDLLARFFAEQRILARLSHPHIARLIDGGVTADGLPYFALEYVDGCPITDYADRHGLGVEARLRLFDQVCEAVQCAHQHLVVHRDLKPSNLLVTTDPGSEPGRATVKLLDFGIAKLLQPGPADAPVLTATGVRVMTPAYAAPEQVRGGPITTATDVYALGVILYELLTGQRPYDLDGASGATIERIVCETSPPRPSTQVSRRTDAPPAGPARAGLDPERLRRRLKGDLDTIILKALRKDPAERYGTVDQLREDLRRHLAGLPVRARPLTWRYRTHRFVRRHRAPVVAAVLIAALLAGFSILTARQAARIETQAAVVAEERDKAEEVARFLVSLFRSADPGEARGEDVTARTLLERGRARVEEELAGQPAVQATMLGVMGEVYEALGDYAEAEALARQALLREQAVHGPRHAATATALNRLGWIRHLRGDEAGADSTLRAALALRQAVLGPDHLDVARTMNDLAVVAQARGDYAATDTLLRAALALRQARLGPEHMAVATTLNNLAALRWRLGDYDGAARYFEQALTVFRTTLGEMHPRIAITLNNLAVTYQVQGDLDRAEARYREALAMRRRLFGDAHPEVARSLNTLGHLLTRRGDYAAADSLLTEALALRRALLGPRHPDLASTLVTLAGLREAQGRYAEAERLHREALAMREALLGHGHAEVAESLGGLARLERRRGRPADAARLYREALAVERQALGPQHPRVAETLRQLGLVEQDLGHLDAAVAHLREALALARTALGAEHATVAGLHVDLAAALIAQGAAAEAVGLLRHAAEVGDAETAARARALMARIAPPPPPADD
ncbi:hypothetical protein AWN76_010720 [Rhodothermaceae bacterium RA]|nr:hypothetical protein AWN76_010720 [Rhodothermaceae bacterium RA]